MRATRCASRGLRGRAKAACCVRRPARRPCRCGSARRSPGSRPFRSMRPVRSPLRFRCPRTHAAGDYAALAQVDGGVGGATVHVDANAGGLSLEVSPQCSPCEARADVPLLVKSSRGDAIVHVKVVRSPHVYVGYVPNGIPWATTTWVDQTVRTGARRHGDGRDSASQRRARLDLWRTRRLGRCDGRHALRRADLARGDSHRAGS